MLRLVVSVYGLASDTPHTPEARSRRQLPILDTYGHIPHPLSAAERPWAQHGTTDALGEGDYGTLVRTLASAFVGSADAVTLAYCRPYVSAFFNFHLADTARGGGSSRAATRSRTRSTRSGSTCTSWPRRKARRRRSGLGPA